MYDESTAVLQTFRMLINLFKMQHYKKDLIATTWRYIKIKLDLVNQNPIAVKS